MTGDNHQAPGLSKLLRKLASTAAGMVENRGELLAVEWQEERLRLAELLVRIVILLFLAMMAVLLLTATVIFLFPEAARLYIAAGFALLYLLAALATGLSLRSVLREEPFAESLSQVKKDRVWLDSFK